MKVFRVEISDTVVEAALARMQLGPFTRADIHATVSPLLRAPARVTPGLVERLATRLIAKHRDRGDLATSGDGWCWVARESVSQAPVLALAASIVVAREAAP